jgi:Tol biopolymer transport system component
MSLKPGSRLGPYEIRGLLGAGGMGEVYRAHDPKLSRDVAIKVLPDGLTSDPALLERFEREAKAVAALSHPNILAIYDFGTADGHAYAVMELLEGRTLREWLAEGPLGPTKAAALARNVARGLGAAHGKGIVHRDLKPENVFVTSDGQAKILDFGLAVARDVPGVGKADAMSPTRTSFTQPGVVMGTVGYMAPEQVRGEPADHRSDIFSFGSTLYEMLTGQRAFERETQAETMTAILREEPSPPADHGGEIPTALLRVVGRCMEKQPDERFQSARDLAFAIENSTQVSGVQPVRAEPAPAGGKSRAMWAAVLLAALVGLGAGYLLRGGSDAPAVVEPPQVRRLTVSGHDRQPTASPDGGMVAFTSSRDGTPRIWLKQLAGGGEQPLTEGTDVSPRFSPDGSTILFLREEASGLSIYRQALVGGQARKLVENAGDPCWSPDGALIAYTRQLFEGGTAVYVTDAQRGGEGRRIHESRSALYGLSWSPDGTTLSAVETTLTGNFDNVSLVLLDADGGPPRSTKLGGFPLTPALWIGPDRLVLARAGSLLGDQGDALSRVLRYDVGTGEQTTLFWARHLFPTQGLRVNYAEFDRVDAGKLVFHQTDLRQHLRLAIVGRAEDPAAPSRQLSRGEGRDRQPAVSPDGTRMLFSSNRAGNLDLWMMDLESGLVDQVTDDAAQDWDPGFTPDGHGIVWSSDRSGHLEIWYANVDGSGARQVSRDGVDAENPTVTADGEWLVYWSANPDKMGVWKVRLDGSVATQLAAGPFMQPEVSPDGRYASFVLIESTLLKNTIRVVELDSGVEVPFSIEVPVPLNAPGIIYGRTRWLPDGSGLAYVGLDERGRTGIYAQDFVPGRDTSATRRPLAGFAPDFVSESFGISPDGKHVVLAGVQRSFRLMLAENVPGID